MKYTAITDAKMASIDRPANTPREQPADFPAQDLWKFERKTHALDRGDWRTALVRAFVSLVPALLAALLAVKFYEVLTTSGLPILKIMATTFLAFNILWMTHSC